MVELNLIFDMTLSAHAFHNFFLCLRDEFGCNYFVDEYANVKLDGKNIEEYVKKILKKKKYFSLWCENGEVKLHFLASFKIYKLDVFRLCKSVKESDLIVSSFLKERSLLQAWMFDSEYDMRQNIQDIKYYRSLGLDHSGLKTVNNGLPFPLNEDIIDTSINPGRTCIKTGYVEFVGAVMWFNKTLLMKLGSDMEGLLSSRFSISELGEMLRIQAQDYCFTRADDQEADMQDQLRRLIYGA